jgi:hypothetical protein
LLFFFLLSTFEIDSTEKAICSIDVLREYKFRFFREERIRNGSKKLAKARSTNQQGRLENFFTTSRSVTTTTPKAKKTATSTTPIPANTGLKRKKAETSETKPKGKAAGGSAKKSKVK